MEKEIASGVDSGTAVQDAEKSKNEEPKKEDVVAYDTYQRTIKQVKTAKEKIRDLEGKLNQVEQEKLERSEKLREARERELEKNGEYKKLLELKEKELSEARTKLEVVGKESENARKTISDTVKLHAFYEMLPGKIKKREYLNFVDLEGIVLNPETNEIEKASVEGVVNKFMDSYGELVDTSHVGKLPVGHPSSGERVDYSKWKTLDSKEMKKNLKTMVEKRLQGG